MLVPLRDTERHPDLHPVLRWTALPHAANSRWQPQRLVIVFDVATMLRQLGVLPAQATTAERLMMAVRTSD